VFFRRNAKLIVKGMVPKLFHVIPIGDNPVFDGILQSEHASLGLCLITSSERVH